MTLTPARQQALVHLFQDPGRMRRLYPKVAEYLDGGFEPASAQDGLLDLALIDHLTRPAATEPNPYWEIVRRSIVEKAGKRVVCSHLGRGSAQLQFAQFLLQEVYAYAVPSPETLAWIANLCGTRSLCEVGAGRGYWAHLLADRGVTVDAFDIQPPDSTDNPSFPQSPGVQPIWHPVMTMGSLQFNPDVILMLCWPPGWGDPMAVTALRSFEEHGGRTLIYVGEPRGGKTATDGFFDRLSAGWELVSEDPHHVSWWGSSDHVQLFRRTS